MTVRNPQWGGGEGGRGRQEGGKRKLVTMRKHKREVERQKELVTGSLLLEGASSCHSMELARVMLEGACDSARSVSEGRERQRRLDQAVREAEGQEGLDCRSAVPVGGAVQREGRRRSRRLSP